jgi:hypothetical protein
MFSCAAGPHLLAHECPEALGVQPVLVHVVRVGAGITTRARHTLHTGQQQSSGQQAQQQAGIAARQQLQQ